jgi:hypothetical protein
MELRVLQVIQEMADIPLTTEVVIRTMVPVAPLVPHQCTVLVMVAVVQVLLLGLQDFGVVAR